MERRFGWEIEGREVAEERGEGPRELVMGWPHCLEQKCLAAVERRVGEERTQG